MECSKCGRMLPDDAVFCDGCGMKQTAEKKDEPEKIDENSYRKMTKADLRKAAEDKGINVPSNATKEDMVILLLGGKLQKKPKPKKRPVIRKKCSKCGKFLSDDNEDDLCDDCSSCFITTAVCASRNLPDDCHELTSLRHFRDIFMKADEIMKAEVEEYYEIAPEICRSIDCCVNSKEIYEGIYQNYIKPSVAAVDSSDYQSAYSMYKAMVLDLKGKYSGSN